MPRVLNMTTATTATNRETQETFALDWERWHGEHEKVRADQHGFLAVTGLYWLTTAPAPIPGIPGLWSTGASGPVAELADGDQLELDGRALAGTHTFGPLAERSGVLAHHGEIVIEIARRGGHDIVRPRDPAHPLRIQYRGTDTFAPDSRWAIEGRYIPFAAPRDVTVGAAVEGLQHVYEAPGYVEFDIDGTQQRLTVFNGYTPGSLFALFTDATSGVSTYAANRTISIDAPGRDGAVVLDFNRATNLPCAYTEFATCPLPPAENRLAVAIEAGEKKP
jgi:uncharacterized protein (DUF1684 family)